MNEREEGAVAAGGQVESIVDRLARAIQARTPLEAGRELATTEISGETIRAALLRSAVPGGQLCLVGARITGGLDLSRCSVDPPLIFDSCTFEEPLQLAASSLRSLRISGGSVPGVEARHAHFAEDVTICDQVEVASALSFEAARIDGGVDLRDVEVRGSEHHALDFHAATVGEDLRIRDDAILHAPAVLDGATIKGSLLCSATFGGSGAPSLTARLLHVEGDVSFVRVRSGPMRLAGAHIGGRLHVDGGWIASPQASSKAVDLEGIDVAQNLDLDGGLEITGVVYAPFAHVGAQLTLNGISVSADNLMAVNAQGASVAGDVYISEHSRVRGCADFTGATVRGDLVCADAVFMATSGPALNAERADIGGSAFLTGSDVSGELFLIGAHIGGDLDAHDANLRNSGADALLARRMRVDKDLLLGGSTITGTVDLVRAEIGGALRCDGSTFIAPDACALDLRGAQIGGVLLFLPKSPPNGRVDLLDARCAVLHDDASTWPDRMNLDGFTYGSFDPEAPQTVRERLAWLDRNSSGYSSRIYETLVGVYKAYGSEEDARLVALARQRKRARTIPLLLRPVYWFWGSTVGYGYALRRLVPWLVVLLALGSLAFNAAYPSEFIAKAKPTPTFVPFVYTLDLLIPVINLGQRDAWVTTGAAQALGWVYTVAGWVLGAAIVAGLTQIIRRD